MKKWIIAGVVAAGLAAYGWKWRQNYVRNLAILEAQGPIDIAGPADLSVEELMAFEEITDFAYMSVLVPDDED